MQKFWIITYTPATSQQQFYQKYDSEEGAKKAAASCVNSGYRDVYIGIATFQVVKSDPPVTFIPLSPENC